MTLNEINQKLCLMRMAMLAMRTNFNQQLDGLQAELDKLIPQDARPVRKSTRADWQRKFDRIRKQKFGGDA